jgi:hypothetical protein
MEQDHALPFQTVLHMFLLIPELVINTIISWQLSLVFSASQDLTPLHVTARVVI